LKSANGKRYNTDVANTEHLLRIMQSIPLPKTELFKRWRRDVEKLSVHRLIFEIIPCRQGYASDIHEEMAKRGRPVIMSPSPSL
jgi:hypothetical protein